jgi:hypothetical protein
MPKVSLTEFSDFLLKTSGPKLTQVAKIKNKDEYTPAKDYWKRLRDGIVAHHTKGEQDKSKLNAYAEGVDAAKEANYSLAIKGYKKFLGKKNVVWVGQQHEDWTYKNLTVTINPELGIEIDGKHHLIKLYFKEEKLNKSRVAVILQLMKTGLNGAAATTTLSVLEVKTGKMFSHSPAKKNLSTLLEGEADSFLTMWPKV